MKIIDVKLKMNSYSIVVGNGILKDIGRYVKALKCGTDAIIITNPGINKLYGSVIAKSLKAQGLSSKVVEVADGEKSKQFKVAFDVIQQIAQYDVFKKPFVVALGGGVVGDLAGFVASIYKRGIPYIQIPTTLLAQIDSAIGGKTAIDLPVGKNLVGAFYQPRMVFSDVALLRSLDQRQILNGFAEAVKYGVICDVALFTFLEKNYQKLLSGDLKVLELVVAECSKIKAAVVAIDEKETIGLRTILNFGHTIGHAIEAANKFGYYQHGEAVALGMRCAAEISVIKKLCSPKDAVRLNALLDDMGLPKKIGKTKLSDILSLMKRDKKFISGKNRFVLMRKIGIVDVIEGVPEEVIKEVIGKNI
ncbi:MAG: 3-dehydroquinate synthase [Candidatus Omnitrophica bacterium]|nr:3-dehydroquinate synthase [Candidatus Omnitrophota bacterium]